jgi:hypothetical protein
MCWAYIQSLLGPGTHWGRSQEAFQALIDRAVADGQHDAAEHLRMMLERRNAVMMDKEKPRPIAEPGQDGTAEKPIC